MQMRTHSEQRCHGGTFGVYGHRSEALGGLDARYGVFIPERDAAGDTPFPALYALAGLTCDETTFATKSGVLRHAAEHRLAMVFPDTSPRGADIPGEDEDWDFGTGAGFYLDATEAPLVRPLPHGQPRRARASGPDRGPLPGPAPTGAASPATRWAAMAPSPWRYSDPGRWQCRLRRGADLPPRGRAVGPEGLRALPRPRRLHLGPLRRHPAA